MSRTRKWLISLAIAGSVIALIWSQLPRAPYSTDLAPHRTGTTRAGAGV